MVVAFTVTFILNVKVGDWHPVVVLVINVIAIGNDTLADVVVKAPGVVKVNVPDPVPATLPNDTLDVPLLYVPDTDQPWVDATLETVIL